ncbi:MAG TPA: ParB/RepB/Spo0J family partition protein [Candidatus Paceibacterota bacterium]|nr:ParB/RepB/Spo0J family partition protein [Candidatus Paceibacterota bacterium]
MASQFSGDSIFWIDTEKVRPNPYQPRREFDEGALRALAESIRMYGLLQPLVVTRTELVKEDGGISVEYELISGERRLRASKLLGLPQVPAIIRADSENARLKLELAIIENLQREDLNPVERARSFQQLAAEFGLKHIQIAQKVGKSREYVSNSIRLLALRQDMLDALSNGQISEGHARPLLMLGDRPAEQDTLFKEIIFKRLTVRETELIARTIAVEKSRKAKVSANLEFGEFEKKLSEALHTRVQIEQKQKGGKITIDFFSPDDIRAILSIVQPAGMTAAAAASVSVGTSAPASPVAVADVPAETPATAVAAPIDDRSKAEKDAEENSEDLYSLKNFSL